MSVGRGQGQGLPKKKSCWEERLCSARSLSLSWSLLTHHSASAKVLPPHSGWLPEPWTSWSYTMDPFPKAEVVAKQKPLPPHPSRCTPPRNLSSELTHFP